MHLRHGAEFRRSEVVLHRLHGQDGHRFIIHDDFLAHLAAQRGQRALQVPHPRLAGIAANDFLQERHGKADVRSGQAVPFPLARHEVALRNFQLLLLGVPGEVDHLHPVQEGRRNGARRIGRSDEEHVRKVKGHVHVIVREGLILLRIQRLQESRRGVAPVVGAHLVDFVEKDHRIHGLGMGHRFDEAPRHGADVGAPMPPDFRLIVNASESDACEIAPHRSGDGLGQAGLAHAGRTGEAENGPLRIGGENTHRQVFENAVLHLLQAVVVFIEHALRLLQIQIVLRLHAPGHVEDPVQIVADHRGLGHHGRHRLQAGNFLFHLFPDILRHGALLQLLPVLRRFLLRGLAVAELIMNGFDFLAQIVIVLLLFHAAPHVLIQLHFQRAYFHLRVHQGLHLAEPGGNVRKLEHLLPFLGRHEELGSDKVRRLPRVIDGFELLHELIRQVLLRFIEPLEKALQNDPAVSLHFHAGTHGLHHVPHGRGEVPVPALDGGDLHPGNALREHAKNAPGELEHLLDFHHRAHRIEL